MIWALIDAVGGWVEKWKCHNYNYCSTVHLSRFYFAKATCWPSNTNMLIDFCVKLISKHLHHLYTCVWSQSAGLSEKGEEMQQRIVNGQKTFFGGFLWSDRIQCVMLFCTAQNPQFIDAHDVHSKSNTCLGSRVSKHIWSALSLLAGPAGGTVGLLVTQSAF